MPAVPDMHGLMVPRYAIEFVAAHATPGTLEEVQAWLNQHCDIPGGKGWVSITVHDPMPYERVLTLDGHYFMEGFQLEAGPNEDDKDADVVFAFLPAVKGIAVSLIEGKITRNERRSWVASALLSSKLSRHSPLEGATLTIDVGGNKARGGKTSLSLALVRALQKIGFLSIEVNSENSASTLLNRVADPFLQDLPLKDTLRKMAGIPIVINDHPCYNAEGQAMNTIKFLRVPANTLISETHTHIVKIDEDHYSVQSSSTEIPF